ncbi:GAF domain-containing protein [Microcoleus sp. FACHB-1515]|uniref:GAF domain-containing protein n=1 Tax=Cyanophyceae TaxID=3028117 RepID=UPI0016890C7E|nr:GAF domain-containing protein [Microcoleus sp. FACHB-1515]MBD2092359.1 GAF domain-containing protein [Microcoleus sp. FACHB-1515]
MSTETSYPDSLEQIFAANRDPQTTFTALLPALCEVLQTDRCFLLVRDPATRMHQNLCWRRRSDLPDTSTNGWEPEEEWEREDPMFAAALRTDPSIFVEDIETTSADILNVEFERNMGHRALVHAHIAQANQLWGILQPAVFGRSRIWSEFDRAVILQTIDKLRPLVIPYVQQCAP